MDTSARSKTNRLVGSPVERTEDLRFLRGRGQYIGDFKLVDQQHAVIVRSSVAHGRLRGIDASAALAMPGVTAVITAKDIPSPLPVIPFRRPNPTITPFAQPVIASDVVRYVGEPIAVILATTAEIAEDALQTVMVDIEHWPAITDHRDGPVLTPPIFPGTPNNRASLFIADKGDCEPAFRDATFTIRDRFSIQRMTAMPMETRGLVAQWDNARKHMTVSGAAKLPFFNRRALAGMLGLPETSVDYVEYDVGGGFGARGELYPEDFLVAFAARLTGKPVKWVEDRREHFMSIAHSRETYCDVELALDKDGVMLAVRGDMRIDIGAFVRPNGMTPVRNSAQFLTAPYRLSNIHLEAHAMLSNKVPAGTYRGPGRFESCFVMERLIDMAARATGLDRLDIRRRNLLRPDNMPYPLASTLPNDGFGDTACDSGDYLSPFERCLTEIGWHDKLAQQGALINGKYYGVGIGCFVEGGGSGPREHARMEADSDRGIILSVGSSAIGQGLETIFGQIAADALDVPMDRIRVLHGSTTLLAEGFGSYGSRSTVMGGNAVVATANIFLAEFRKAAAERLRVKPDDLTIAGCVATAPDGSHVGLAELASARIAVDGLFANSKATYTYGTAAAHVAVDPKTGKVDVLDYIVVDDVGRIINPLTLHGQVIGAAVQGLGSVFTEEIVYDKDGQLLIGSLADYMVPVSTDYPHVRAVSLEEHPCPNNPLGTKGAGEGGIIPVAAAVANAIAAALSPLGVEPRDLPITPPRLWKLIQAARKN